MLCLGIILFRRLFASCVLASVLTGCVAFEPAFQSNVEEMHSRPFVAILPIGFDLEITQLSDVKSMDATLSTDEEATQLQAALFDVCQEARWLLMSRLAAAQGFRFVPVEETDALARELALKPGTVPNPHQVAEFGKRLGADLVVGVNILDYGKIRWQWLAAGMFADMTWETAVIGLASAWNPALILGNVGYELLTSTPLWFGGGYLFGVSMRPVRVEARAFETHQGYPIWQVMEESVYARAALKMLPESIRGKKEAQLQLNMAEIMESIGDGLTKQEFIAGQFGGQAEFAKQ